MSRFAAIVLYEDQRGLVTQFGPHALVEAMVYDEINGDRPGLKTLLDGRPMKGVTKLLATCKRDFPKLRKDTACVVAVFDNDRIRQHLALGNTADIDAVRGAITTKCKAPDLRVVVLEQNTESLVDAAAACLSRPIAPIPKEHAHRDKVLAQAAWDPDRGVRDCIRKRVRAVDELASLLAQAVLAVRAQ